MKYTKTIRHELINTVCEVKNTLWSCLNSGKEFLPQFEILAKAICTLNKVVQENEWIKYDRRDELKYESEDFKRGLIYYISGTSGKATSCAAVYFSEFGEIDIWVSSGEGLQRVNWPIKENYKLGNPAIGQIFLGNKQYYSVRIAVEYSLKATCERWFYEAQRLDYHLRNDKFK